MILLSLLFSTSVYAKELSFEKVELKINNVKINAQIADTEEKREHGLMFVKSLPPNSGMLFVFEDEQPRSFWMKNTLIPLSIGFFNSQGVLVDEQEMKPTESLMDRRPPIYPSAAPAALALEMNAQWFKKNHIKLGSKLILVGVAKSALLKQMLRSSARQTSRGHSGESRQTGD